MAMELVTGYAGKAHVTSYQDAAIQAGIVGVDNGVLSYVGQGMKAVATSANNIRIYDGVALIGGKAVVIDRDTYQDVAIANGTVGKYRNDIIYIKYTKDAFTGVESVTFDVKQGAAGNSGIDPALTTNNLYSTGTLTSEIPFKRVRLNGLAIESVENMHDNVPSLTELNRKLPFCGRGKGTVTSNEANSLNIPVTFPTAMNNTDYVVCANLVTGSIGAFDKNYDVEVIVTKKSLTGCTLSIMRGTFGFLDYGAVLSVEYIVLPS